MNICVYYIWCAHYCCFASESDFPLFTPPHTCFYCHICSLVHHQHEKNLHTDVLKLVCNWIPIVVHTQGTLAWAAMPFPFFLPGEADAALTSCDLFAASFLFLVWIIIFCWQHNRLYLSAHLQCCCFGSWDQHLTAESTNPASTLAFALLPSLLSLLGGWGKAEDTKTQ